MNYLGRCGTCNRVADLEINTCSLCLAAYAEHDATHTIEWRGGILYSAHNGREYRLASVYGGKPCDDDCVLGMRRTIDRDAYRQ